MSSTLYLYNTIVDKYKYGLKNLINDEYNRHANSIIEHMKIYADKGNDSLTFNTHSIQYNVRNAVKEKLISYFSNEGFEILHDASYPSNNIIIYWGEEDKIPLQYKRLVCQVPK